MDLFQKLKTAHMRVLATTQNFEETVVNALPLTLENSWVASLAGTYGWQDAWMEAQPAKRRRETPSLLCPRLGRCLPSPCRQSCVCSLQCLLCQESTQGPAPALLEPLRSPCTPCCSRRLLVLLRHLLILPP